MTLAGRIAQILASCAEGGAHRARAPQGVTIPYIVFTFIASPVLNVIEGAPPANNGRLQVDVYSTTAAEADAAMDAVIAAMQAAADARNPSNYNINSPSDLPDPDTRLYRVMTEFSVWS